MPSEHSSISTEQVLKRIANPGAFLTVQSGGRLNTMTIGWAQIGWIWSRPVMCVLVRPSRYTFGLIETAEDFTVSAPLVGMEKELAFCGSRSGRDTDKFAACGLSTRPSRAAASPVIAAAGMHYECRIVLRTAMDPGRLSPGIARQCYGAGDFHTLYFGEILAQYATE